MLNSKTRLTKERLKQLIYGSELRVVALISNGLVHHTPKRTVLVQIRKELLRCSVLTGLNDVHRNRLWMEYYALYNKISKKTFSTLRKLDLKFGKKEDYEESLRQRSNVVYESVRKEAIFNHRLEHNKNILANDVEELEKRDSIRAMLNAHISPFFLCSTHEKPAKDHADWEGKLYYDADWERYAADENRAMIAEFIQKEKLRTVQWVTGEPVYLITRPNCKHFFINISVEDALGMDLKELLSDNKMIMPNDLPMSEAKMAYKGYYERLKALRYLKSIAPSEKLDEDIKNTAMLVRKWNVRAKIEQ